MPKYVIERDIPGAGKMSTTDKQGAAKQSNSVIEKLGEQIHWVHSYITPDKIYCIYIAPSEEVIQQHADLSGFPANRISEVKALVDPTTESRADELAA